ncbi:MAG: hypothetical protein D6766_01310 [Verrucomicrobia bacterium]|nr:MAG: hypothetical protein D6766_01310 [Verrucomicrobiota bacterium]
MDPMTVITLTTDFGHRDWFVGAIKGVILRQAPGARIVDVAHDAPAGDVASAAFLLGQALQWFPEEAIHVAVIDPGVGGERAPLALRWRRGFLVGPDNGLWSWLERLTGHPVGEARRIENPACRLPELSRTFHGRDLFAPAAAWLAAGGRFEDIGPAVAPAVTLPWPEPQPTGDGWRGQVLYVDHFGNLITNLRNDLLLAPAGEWVLRWGAEGVAPVADHYGAVKPGEPVAVPGSTGFLELAVNQRSASRMLGLGRGAVLELARRQNA